MSTIAQLYNKQIIEMRAAIGFATEEYDWFRQEPKRDGGKSDAEYQAEAERELDEFLGVAS